MDDKNVEKTKVKTFSVAEINEAWSKAHALQIQRFKEQNPDAKLPIVKNKQGLYRWVNRKERRAKNIRF